ncbi:hypothetical protein C4573_04050 [Candidatus Woesearchaeota archaeon]|nr:MAG: hypothetical protein C4573_04050 [Candidatus Woesearchaeota archaeon]
MDDQWTEIPEDWELPEQKQEEPEIYFSDSLIALYTAFQNQVHKPKSVLYPSCGFDASPAKVFDKVTFVDAEKGNEGCIEKLKEAGLTAYKQDIKVYQPSELHDLVILLNPAIPHEWATRHMQTGYVIANEYHHTATELFHDPQFRLWGTLDFIVNDFENKRYEVKVSQNLEGLFEEVQTIEDLKALNPDYAEFLIDSVESFASDDATLKTFDEKWAAFRTALHQHKPYRRKAELYIFKKNVPEEI